MRAFIGLTGGTDAEAFFHSVTSGSFLAKTVLWMCQTVLGDGILVCYTRVMAESLSLNEAVAVPRSGGVTSFMVG